jgi:hypothetical protein
MSPMIAACGLDCALCDIQRASDDPALAQEIIDWFDRELDVEVKPEDIHCDSCKGDRTNHWSPDCWILKCCVDDKGLDFCHQCLDFPCQELSDWAEKSQKYTEAFERLKRMSVTGEA